MADLGTISVKGLALRECKQCEKAKPETSFGFTGTKRYRRRVCEACRKKAYIANNREEHKAKQRSNRKRNPFAYMLYDLRNSDKRNGRSICDLDLTDLKGLLESSACFYCEEVVIKMTLDRRDNTKGHTKDNVVAACLRCNLLRGDMPYEAWQVLIPTVREVVKLGLFGSWRSLPINQRPKRRPE